MSEWKETKLQEIAVINPAERLAKGTKAKKVAMELLQPFTKKISTYTKEEYKGGVKFRNGDTLVARITPSLENGKTSFVDLLEDDEVGFGSTEFIVLREIKGISDKNYLFYLACSPEFRDLAIASMTGSSGRQRVQTDVVKQHEFLFPPLPEQRAIASVLSSLDDKIDLLHRQNKTLEAMAETLFRQWFVEEADEGWEEGMLGDVIELIYGKGLKKEIRTDTGCPVIGSSGVVGYHSEFLVEGPGIVIGRKGTLGKVIYLWDNFFPIDTTYYIKSKVESAGLLYEYFLLKTLNFEEMNSDSAVPGLNRDIALSTEIKIAPLGKLNKFNQFTSTFINKLRDNIKQIRTLEKLRDTLLPKLMSREVRMSY
ncbi:MAG: Type I restriction modification DNA specificity domain protein [Candidatus Argoarchaeum ethanivorans]|uniref:Type I restriction modification DNA specificity domain protein n=1 Tax=Candidatus Argoarchaeum ethanivorans TaxID=2608793 RepID=A0A811TAZ0_9EURY|nr:MAG: Type I restriction modification DNA specificity domain protein [Candidatus Argoarchaeum ethanivorans]